MTDSMFPDPLIPPLRDNAYLISLIADVIGADRSHVAEYLRQEHLNFPLCVSEAFDAKGLKRHVWSAELLDFFEETDCYFYPVVVWNRTRIKCAMRRWLLDFLYRHRMSKGRILLCGDGIGVDSFFLAQAGYEVVSYEISRYGQQIARRLFDDYQVNVQMTDTLETLEPETFDAVFSLDVLEHVPSPPDMVRDHSKLLRPGGFFVVSAPFYMIHPRWCTHLKCNRKYSGRTAWLEQAGQMKLIDGRTLGNPFVFQKIDNDEQNMFSLPWGKRLSLGWGKVLLRFFALFPAPIAYLTLCMFRRDTQVKQLIPSDSP